MHGCTPGGCPTRIAVATGGDPTLWCVGCEAMACRGGGFGGRGVAAGEAFSPFVKAADEGGFAPFGAFLVAWGLWGRWQSCRCWYGCCAWLDWADSCGLFVFIGESGGSGLPELFGWRGS
ncbi:MAG: hypothetical protein C7K11_03605 [Candidatus Amulumruptor caecigallinarius]|nr:MAG: hypothetical protein C7K11_03605 [Candidatus Amulumruptor caecigallinarius]